MLNKNKTLIERAQQYFYEENATDEIENETVSTELVEQVSHMSDISITESYIEYLKDNYQENFKDIIWDSGELWKSNISENDKNTLIETIDKIFWKQIKDFSKQFDHNLLKDETIKEFKKLKSSKK